MLAPCIPLNEVDRLKALNSYQILHTAAESAFDEIVELAVEICDTPIGLISLVDETTQWFKAKVGLDAQQTERSISFCAHAILENEIFEINDTLTDERFVDNPLVIHAPNIRFYAGAPLTDDDGYNLGTLCIIDRQPRRLTRTQRNVLSVLRTHVVTLLNLRKQNLELKATNEALNAFTTAASHDLISPARRIIGFTDIVREDHAKPLPQLVDDYLTKIRSSAEHMIDLVDGLLSLARVSKSSLSRRRVNISEIAKDVLQELTQDTARQTDVAVQDDLHVLADPTLTQIVLENLIRNAWKFTAKNSLTKIQVTGKNEANKDWICVHDNGVGFDVSQLNKLYLPFQRLHSQREFKGNGIGLTTVRNIITRHAGEIKFASRINKGTTVSFTFDSN